MQRFTGHLTEEFPEDQLEKERRLQKLAQLSQELSTDSIAIEHHWFEEAFQTAESYETEYHTSPEYGLALQYLKRLYIIREQTTPLRTTRNYSPDNDAFGSFATVLRGLIEEL